MDTVARTSPRRALRHNDSRRFPNAFHTALHIQVGRREKAVRRNPCCVLPLDEIGIFLQGVSNKNSGGHERRVRKALLELYSLGKSIWNGKETADPKKDVTPVWSPTVRL